MAAAIALCGLDGPAGGGAAGLQNTTWPAMPRAVLDLLCHGSMNGAIHAMACRHADARGPPGPADVDLGVRHVRS